MTFRKRYAQFRNRKRATVDPATSSNEGAGLAPREQLPYGTRVPPSELVEARRTLEDGRAFAPHCDQRILHQHGDCWSCDLYPDWQKIRQLWGIAFTGHAPREGQLPCPADHNRPPDSPSDHRQWPGNTAAGEDWH